MELRTLIEEYLQKARLMQVATSRDNQPWACSVYFAFDEDLNLYWLSKPSTRHSEELRHNEKVAGTIVLPHTPGDKIHGIQFQGTAQELTNTKEAAQGLKYYADRMGMGQERVNSILQGSDGHLCYKITPSSYVLFDVVHFPDDPRQELKL